MLQSLVTLLGLDDIDYQGNPQLEEGLIDNEAELQTYDQMSGAEEDTFIKNGVENIKGPPESQPWHSHWHEFEQESQQEEQEEGAVDDNNDEDGGSTDDDEDDDEVEMAEEEEQYQKRSAGPPLPTKIVPAAFQEIDEPGAEGVPFFSG